MASRTEHEYVVQWCRFLNILERYRRYVKLVNNFKINFPYEWPRPLTDVAFRLVNIHSLILEPAALSQTLFDFSFLATVS